MAVFSSRKIVKARLEFVIPNPSNMTEFGKAYGAAVSAWKAENPDGREYDDTFKISANEEEIIISFKTKAPQ